MYVWAAIRLYPYHVPDLSEVSQIHDSSLKYDSMNERSDSSLFLSLSALLASWQDPVHGKLVAPGAYVVHRPDHWVFAAGLPTAAVLVAAAGGGGGGEQEQLTVGSSFGAAHTVRPASPPLSLFLSLYTAGTDVTY